MVANNEEGISKNNIVYAIQICLFVFALINIYYNPNIPSDLKSVITLALGGVFAIVYIILEIISIKRELNSLKKRAK